MKREREISKAARKYIITDKTCGVGVQKLEFYNNTLGL